MKRLIKNLLNDKLIHSLRVKANRFFGKNSIKVASGNTLILGHTLLSNCTIRIHGHNNRIAMGA